MRFAALKKKAIVLPALLALGLLSLAALGGSYWLNREVKRPHSHQSTQKIITIEPRSSTGVIAARLHQEGILAREWPLMLWMKVAARGKSFKAGDYEFKSPITPLEVINKLTRGEVASRQFTIPEGYNQFEIARALAALPGLKQPPPENPEDLLELFRNISLIADLDPEAETLEGFLFPDTYEYVATTTREQLVETMVRRFRKVYTAEMQQRARALNMTTHQVVTLASLIEEEARVDAERELISQVYHLRLKRGEKLDCDPTVIYAALIAGKYRGRTIYRSDLDRNSPYNTYKNPGLPPGPIASPGRRSLQAALNPADTNYLFFVVDTTRNDGSHKFSVTAKDHNQAVAALRRWERQQRPSK
jgi:UPF0755 protein